MNKYQEFEKFKKERFEKAPWDNSNHPRGFPQEKLGFSSDISAHLPILQYFASQCNIVTEFGVREGASTSAFIAGAKQKVISYDLYNNEFTNYLQNLNRADKLPCKWEFNIRNVATDFEMENTDFLFVDDLHEGAHVAIELEKHGKATKRFLGFHDVFSQGEKSIDRPQGLGILKAINDYTKNHNFKLIYQVDFNHGCSIYERT